MYLELAIRPVAAACECSFRPLRCRSRDRKSLIWITLERNGQRERINKSEALARRSAVPGINPTGEPSQHFEEDPAFRNHVIGSPRQACLRLAVASAGWGGG